MSRTPSGKWKPGYSPNPGGGPGRLRGKGVVAFIGDQTRDGLELAEYFLRVLRGHEKGASPADKRAAAFWLADRYMGKSVDVQLTGELSAEDNPLAEVSSDTLRTLIRAVANDRNTLGDGAHALPAGDAPPAAATAPPCDAELAPVPTQPPAPAPSTSPPRSLYEKCPSCGLKGRTHEMDCPERTRK